MIESPASYSIRPRIRAHECGAPAVCPEPAEPSPILRLGPSVSVDITLETGALQAKGSTPDTATRAERA
jgi:hypothetical protein